MGGILDIIIVFNIQYFLIEYMFVQNFVWNIVGYWYLNNLEKKGDKGDEGL